MRKSVKIRIICLITATVVLSGAVFAAAVMGSPYETIKNALLDAVTYRNATAETYMTMSVNGILTEESKTYGIQGDSSSLSYSFDENGDKTGFHYSSNRLYLHNLYPATPYYILMSHAILQHIHILFLSLL